MIFTPEKMLQWPRTCHVHIPHESMCRQPSAHPNTVQDSLDPNISHPFAKCSDSRRSFESVRTPRTPPELPPSVEIPLFSDMFTPSCADVYLYLCMFTPPYRPR